MAEEKQEISSDFFYYRFYDVVFENEKLFMDNPEGFSDYLFMLRYRSGIRGGRAVPYSGSPYNAR